MKRYQQKGHEVDFALVQDDTIQKLVEVKLSNHAISKSLNYFKEKYNLESVQVIKNLKQEQVIKGISLLTASRFLKSLFL